MKTKNNILVTSALPYANGPIHLGHLVEYIQTDIWVRSQRILGNHCIYLCASDAHGTPVMMKAEEENISPEKLVDNLDSFADFYKNFLGIIHDSEYKAKELLKSFKIELRGNSDRVFLVFKSISS